MWYLSSLPRLSSSSLLARCGGLKSLSFIPSRYAGGLDNRNGVLRSDSVSRPELEKYRFQSSENARINLGFVTEKENVSKSNSFASQGFSNSASQKDIEISRNSRSMEYVREIIEQDRFQSSRYNVEHNADIVYMKLKRNNTFINVTDSKGNTKFRATSGLKHVTGGGKVGRYAAEATAEYAGRTAREMGLKSVVVKVNGFIHFKKKKQGIMSFRDGFTNSRSDQNPIMYIEDTTRRPHNGCRLPKKRRT